MSELMKQWPPVLLRRWLLTVALGLGFLVVGLAVWLALRDRTFLYLSGVVFLLSLGRAVMLFRCFLLGDYEVLEGVCIQTAQFPLQRYRKVRFLNAEEQEFTLMLGKQQRVQVGSQYRLYLQRGKNLPLPGGWLSASLAAGNLLGIELVDGEIKNS